MVLLLAGATSTLIAGQIAVARRLPILAVDEFGGSAGKIWRQLAQASPHKTALTWGNHSVNEFVKQLKGQCDQVAIARANKQNCELILARILSRRNQSAYAAVALITMLFALALGTVFVKTTYAYTGIMLFGLVAAGAVGAAVRTILAEPGSADPRTSVLLGCIAGVIVGLAYLIPQWVASSGPLSTEPVAITPADKIQFVSSVLIAVSAGVGFDTIFNRLSKQTESFPVAPPG